MEVISRNIDKIKPFLEAYEKGEIIYKDGALYKTTKRLNQFKTVKLDEPEIMRVKLGDKNGRYYRITTTHNGKRYTVYEHIVIFAIHYGIEALEKSEAIDHVDGNKNNNRYENLEGVSIEENNLRSKNLGLLKPQRGAKNKASKLTEEQVLDIRALYSEGTYNQYELAKKYGITQGHVSDIVNSYRWVHV